MIKIIKKIKENNFPLSFIYYSSHGFEIIDSKILLFESGLKLSGNFVIQIGCQLIFTGRS